MASGVQPKRDFGGRGAPACRFNVRDHGCECVVARVVGPRTALYLRDDVVRQLSEEMEHQIKEERRKTIQEEGK